MEELPNELGELICSCVGSARDLAALMLVSKRWNALAASNAAWKRVYFSTCARMDEHSLDSAHQHLANRETGSRYGLAITPAAQEEMCISFLPHNNNNEEAAVLVVSPPAQHTKTVKVQERHPLKEGRVRSGHRVDYKELVRIMAAGKGPSQETKPVLMKVVLIGNLGVGKTSLVARLSGNALDPTDEDSIPVKFDNRTLRMYYGRQEARVSLWDTEMWDTSFSLENFRRQQIREAGEDYSQMRLITYLNTDVFLLCYDLTDKTSFEYIQSKWVREIFSFAPYTPYIIIVCGTKSDLKEERQVSKEDALACANSIKAFAYVECSTVTGENVDNVVIACVDGVMEMLTLEAARPNADDEWSYDGRWRDPLGGWSDQVLNPNLDAKGRWMERRGDVGRWQTATLVENNYLAFVRADHTILYED